MKKHFPILLKKIDKDASEMTAKETRLFVDIIKNSEKQSIKKLLKETDKAVASYLAKQAAKKVIKKVCKRAAVPILAAFFIYDWANGGFEYAVNEAVWPLNYLPLLPPNEAYQIEYLLNNDDGGT